MCTCIKTVNEKLVEHNSEIELPFMGRQQPFVTTIKLNEKKRGKPIRVFATFCPFCGEKYVEETRGELDQGQVDQSTGDPA